MISTVDFNSLARIARLPKLYRLTRIMKMVRVFKMMNNRNRIMKYLNEQLKLKAGSERLFYFLIGATLFTHIMSCMWYFLAKLDDFSPDTWVVRQGYIN